jgi:hypothetical protein
MMSLLTEPAFQMYALATAFLIVILYGIGFRTASRSASFTRCST